MTTPLQVLGGPELLVILFIFLIPVAIVVGVAYLLQRRSNAAAADERRIDELEHQVEELQSEAESRDHREQSDKIDGESD
ncbi:hypothetical protein AB7C87_21735 [Natrarchaeobius sp. A-rgal3]|uniref:preprotein translocase subunit TatA n=1 Tax=Natrarchaeobius versutus TaxID=1679078 RepID=UPI00350F9FB8